MITKEDMSVGCLLAATCGDALGKVAEFLPLLEVRRLFGVLKDFHPTNYLAEGHYTDDTTLMLSICDSIIEKGCIDAENCASKAVDWYNRPPRRGYGPNTLKALELLESGASYQETAGNMPSNGAAMRIAPIGLVCVGGKLPQCVKDAVAWSHRNPAAISAAVVMASAVQNLVRGCPAFNHPYVLDKVLHLVGCSDEVAIENIVTPNQFGNNFAIDAFESVCLTAWVFMTHKDPEEAVIRAVNLGGDADTIGCMVGALCGAKYGSEWIPKRWSSMVENRTLIRDFGNKISKIAL